MPTNKIVLRTPEQLMADYTPIYTPMTTLVLGSSKSYPQEAGQQTFKRLIAAGNLRAQNITPKDTEIKQIGVMEGSKIFKKYFFANQYQTSVLQDAEQFEDVVKQVLDAHWVHQDSLLLEGDGQNNGLYTSSDPNYDLENSVAIAAGSDADHLQDFVARIMTSAQKADQVAGRKLLVVYGASVKSLYNGLFLSSSRPVKSALAEMLPSYQIAQMPDDCLPSGSPNGWMIINLDQIVYHYTTLPGLDAQGVNDEKMYLWANFLMGSSMVDVKAKNGIIRQPATLA